MYIQFTCPLLTNRWTKLFDMSTDQSIEMSCKQSIKQQKFEQQVANVKTFMPMDPNDMSTNQTIEQQKAYKQQEEFEQQVADYKTFMTNNPESNVTLKEFRAQWIADQFSRNTGLPCWFGFPETGQSRLQKLMVNCILGHGFDLANAQSPPTKPGDIDNFIAFARQDPRSTITFKAYKLMIALQ